MYSMTGYGKGTAALDGRELTVELKSVNHRFLDVGLRLPRSLNCIEDTLRKTLSARLSRGHIDIYVNYSNTRSDAKSVRLDAAVLTAYVKAARELNLSLGLADDLTLSNVLRLPDVAEVLLAEEDSEALNALCAKACDAAIDQLLAMRLAEGDRLKADLADKLRTLRSIVAKIEKRAPFVVISYRDKLNERIAQLVTDTELDRARLATEVALFADRAAIDEELTRLGSHMEQFLRYLGEDAPVGRNLDFVIQEMNRECNTIGSKANDAELTQLVLLGKAEIEKLREQVQNIE